MDSRGYLSSNPRHVALGELLRQVAGVGDLYEGLPGSQFGGFRLCPLACGFGPASKSMEERAAEQAYASQKQR